MYIKCTKAHSANTMLTTFHTRHKLYTLYNLNTRTKRISETLRNSCGNENNKEKHYYFIHCFNVQIFTSTKEKMASFFSFDFACYRTYAIEYSILISFWITLRSKLVMLITVSLILFNFYSFSKKLVKNLKGHLFLYGTPFNHELI